MRNLAVPVVALLAVLALAVPASASDYGYGIGGNPANCTRNWPVGQAEPVKARDGRVVAHTQIWWSDTCAGNWARTWTTSGQATVMETTVFQGRPPAADRRYAYANDYAAAHFTLYIPAGRTEKICAGSQVWDVPTRDWAFSGVYCRT